MASLAAPSLFYLLLLFIASVVFLAWITYGKAIDYYFKGTLTQETKNGLLEELKKVYNRGFSSGFYFGQPGTESFTETYGSIASTRKVFLGKVLNYYKKNNIAHIRLEAESLDIGDSIYIIGSTTGVVEVRLNNLKYDEKEFQHVQKGDEITFECAERVRTNDKVYKIVYLDI